MPVEDSLANSIGLTGYAVDSTGIGGVLTAVSFTHLRAHENVLHFVGRLVLDLKQTFQPTRPHYISYSFSCLTSE